MPNEVTASLQLAATQIARENLLFASESCRLQKEFDNAALPLLFVKGVTLAIVAYGGLAYKRARDIDLVVPPGRVEDASKLLSRLGYIRVEPAPEFSDAQFRTWTRLCKETVWRSASNGIVVELHGALVDNPALLPEIGASLPRNSVQLSSGTSLATLPRDELIAYLCVHGAAHAWSRLKWLADVAALLPTSAPADMERLYERLLLLGVGRCAAQALLLCNLIFGTSLPAALHDRLREDPSNGVLVAIALRVMAGRNQERELDETLFGTLPIHFSHFLLSSGIAYKRAEMLRKLRSPVDRMVLDLPRTVRFLYPLILVPAWIRRRARGRAAG